MNPSRKKWALMALFGLLIGAGTIFLLRLPPQNGAPTPATKASPVAANPDHELKELEVQLQKKPGHLPVLMRMAQIEHDQGKLAEAESHLRNAETQEPARADVHLELGRVLYERGNRDEALTQTEKALALDPKYVDAMYNLGAIHANLGNTQKARSYWESAMAADPKSESGMKARDGLTKLQGR